MKKHIKLLFVNIVFIMAFGCSNKQDGIIESRVMNDVMKYKLPSKISLIIKTIGKPNNSFDDKSSDTCALGQLHYWYNSKYTLFSIGDEYKEYIDYNASTRLIGVKCNNGCEDDRDVSIIGFNLGDSEAEINRKLKHPQYKKYKIVSHNNVTMIHHYVIGKYFKRQYVLEDSVNNEYILLIVDSNGTLTSAIISTINIFDAC